MVRLKRHLTAGLILGLLLCLAPIANAEGPAKLLFLKSIKGTVKKINLKSNQIVLVDKKGRERTIHLDEKTCVEVQGGKIIHRRTSPRLWILMRSSRLPRKQGAEDVLHAVEADSRAESRR